MRETVSASKTTARAKGLCEAWGISVRCEVWGVSWTRTCSTPARAPTHLSPAYPTPARPKPACPWPTP
eukprot:351069-Chlamydomonas_euryale.AAC.2